MNRNRDDRGATDLDEVQVSVSNPPGNSVPIRAAGDPEVFGKPFNSLDTDLACG